MSSLAESEARANARSSLVTWFCGRFLPVGSTGYKDSDQAVTEYSLPIAHRGIATWPQLPQRSKIEGMNPSILHHSEFGLDHDGDGGVVYNENRFIEGGELLTSPSGVDYHHDAAAGYDAFLRWAHDFPQARLVKSHAASQTSAFSTLKGADASTTRSVLDSLSQAFSRGHLRRLRQAFPHAILMLSFDDPGGSATTIENLRTMFAPDDMRPAALRAHHDCSGGPYRELMTSGDVDMIHIDEQFIPSLADGSSRKELRDYVHRNGLFNIGVIPNDYDALARVAGRFRRPIKSMDKGDVRNNHVADTLARWMPDAADIVARRYKRAVGAIARAGRISVQDIADRSAVSGMCGMWELSDLRLQRLALELADETSQRIRIA